jgi:hypothetical protein
MWLNGQWLPDPLANINESGTTEKNFGGDPLFAPGGPSPMDITQGQVGDCQTLASLLGLVSRDPKVISQMIVNLGDGTYAVQFAPMGVDKYVRVNADLPVDSSGNPVYAHLGQQSCLWVALIEKAWTFERPTGGSWWSSYVGTYHNIDGGGANEILNDLDIPWTILSTSNIFNSIVNAVQDGLIVMAASDGDPAPGSGLDGANGVGHEYFVDHVNYEYIPTGFGPLAIPVSLTLRNPHGGSNPWVTVSASVVNANICSAVSTPG